MKMWDYRRKSILIKKNSIPNKTQRIDPQNKPLLIPVIQPTIKKSLTFIV